MTAAATQARPAVPAGRDQQVLLRMISAEPHRLRHRSVSLGVPRDDADDLAQTVLLRALQAWSSLRSHDEGTVCSWLDAMARNAAIDHSRARGRRAAVELDEEVADATDTAEAAIERVALAAALRAVHELPETLRAPLVLSVVDGLSAPEIAARLDMTPAAVRQRLARARQALRTAV